MEGVLNTSGQSTYHSCRQSFETGMGVQNGDDQPVLVPNVINGSVGGDGDSTFVCQKDSSSTALSPSSADVSDLGALVQSNVIAESTRTSIQMNGSGFGNGSGDDSATYEPQPILLAQKLTGGGLMNHAKSSTPMDSSEGCITNGNPALNDCLLNSALGCSTVANNSRENNDGGSMLSATTPLRSKQVEQEVVIPPTEGEMIGENGDEANTNNDNNNGDNNCEDDDDDDDILIDENGGGVRQNRSGSFTVVREKAIPGTPVIEDEPLTEEPQEVRNGSVTPPTGSRSPGLMQDSASRPLIPKAKNRKSIWTADVFSPAALNPNMNNGINNESPPTTSGDSLLLPTCTNPAAVLSTSPVVEPLIDTNSSPVVVSSPSLSSTSSSATYSRSTGHKMLLETIASVGASIDAVSAPFNGSDNNNELSFHSSNGNGNHSYEISANTNGSEENGITSVVDVGNVSAALSSGRASTGNRMTPPIVGDEVAPLVGAGKLEFLGPGSSATITKSKATPVRHQSPASALPPHMMSPAVSCPPMPPASSSPKPHLNGSNGNGAAEPHILCTTPILPAGTNGNGCLAADDADRSELLARISQLEMDNSTLKSKFTKFEEAANQLVVKCSNHFTSAPSASDLEEFLKFVHARLLAAEEVSDDYRSLEASFNELHRRYERARAVIAESQARDRQLQADLVTMKQAATVADQRVNALIHDFETKLADLEAKNTSLEEHLQTEQLKGELRVGQMEIEARNLQQQLQQKDTQIGDLNRLLANAMASTARRG